MYLAKALPTALESVRVKGKGGGRQAGSRVEGDLKLLHIGCRSSRWLAVDTIPEDNLHGLGEQGLAQILNNNNNNACVGRLVCLVNLRRPKGSHHHKAGGLSVLLAGGEVLLEEAHMLVDATACALLGSRGWMFGQEIHYDVLLQEEVGGGEGEGR